MSQNLGNPILWPSKVRLFWRINLSIQVVNGSIFQANQLSISLTAVSIEQRLLTLAATQCFSFPAAPLHLIPARSNTTFTPQSMRQRRVFRLCFSVRSVQSLAALNVGHTDSHGSVLSTTALITTPRAHFQPVASPETRVKRPIAPKRNGIGSIC